MNQQSNQEKISVRTACKALNLTDRTLQRYVKQGRLTKLKEGHRTYFLGEEIRQLKQEIERPFRRNSETTNTLNTVIIPSDKYNDTLSELGALRERCNYLLEYKLSKEKLEKELDHTRDILEENGGFLKETLEDNKKIRVANKELSKDIKRVMEELKRLKSRNIFRRIINK